MKPGILKTFLERRATTDTSVGSDMPIGVPDAPGRVGERPLTRFVGSALSAQDLVFSVDRRRFVSVLHRWRQAQACLLALLALSLAACNANGGLAADKLTFVRYPLAMTADATAKWLLVAGTNFDRMYRSGVVRVLDTTTDQFVPGHQVEIPGFAGGMVLLPSDATPPASPAPSASLGLVLAREDDSLSAFHVSADVTPTLNCNEGDASPEGTDGRCAGDYHFGAVGTDFPVGDDPLDLAVEPVGQHHYRVHIIGTNNGQVSIFDVDPTVTPPKFTPIDSFILDAGLQTIRYSPLTGRLYISDAHLPQLHNYHMEATTDPSHPWRAVLEPAINLPASTAINYGRGMALSSDGATLYVTWRSPNSILILDISPDADGVPRNRVADMIPLSPGPAQVAVAPVGPQGRDLVYAACFDTDRIWVLDPFQRAFTTQIQMPNAVYSLRVIQHPDQGWKLYAALFNLHEIAVIPLQPGVAGQHTVTHVAEPTP